MADQHIYVNTASSGGDGTTNATSGGTAAYASLNSCLTTQDFSATSTDFYIYCDGAGGDDTTAATGTGITIGSGSTINICPNDAIYCAAHGLGSGASGSEYHYGDPSASVYKITDTSYSGTTLVIPSTTANFHVYGLQIYRDRSTQGGTYGMCLNSGCNGGTIRDVICKDESSSGHQSNSLQTGIHGLFYNCLFIGNGTTGSATNLGSYSGVVLRNCGAYNCVTGLKSTATAGSAATLINCWSVGNTTDYENSTVAWNASSATCATSDASAAESFITVLNVDSTAFTNLAGEDFSLSCGSVLFDSGTNTSDAYDIELKEIGTAKSIGPLCINTELRPSSIITQTNLTGSVSDLTNDPDDGTDGNWVTATANNVNVTLEVDFTVPCRLCCSTNQEIRARVRGNNGTNSPDNVSMAVYEGAALVATIYNVANPTYTATTGDVISGTWSASDLSDRDPGADVRVRITCLADTDPAPQRASLDIDSIEWNAAYQPYYAACPEFSYHAQTATKPTIEVSGAEATQVQIQKSEHGHLATKSTISQHHDIPVKSAVHAHAAVQPSLSQHHDVPLKDSVHGHLAEKPTTQESHDIQISASLHAHVAVAPTVTQSQGVQIASSEHIHVATQPAITQVHAVPVQPSIHAHAAVQPTIAQVHAVPVQDSIHAQEATKPGLSAALEVALADSVHAQEATQPTLSQHHQVSIAQALHALVSGALGLTQAHTIPVQDSAHTQAAGKPGIASGGLIGMQDAFHALVSSKPAITQAQALPVKFAFHALLSTKPGITQAQVLAISDSIHAHTVTSPTIGGAGEIPIKNTAHAVISSKPDISQWHAVAVQDALHGHTATKPSIAQLQVLEITDAYHGLISDKPTANEANAIQPDASEHALISTKPGITQHQSINQSNSFHAVTSAKPAITQWQDIQVADSIHALISSKPGAGLQTTIEIKSAAHATTSTNPTIGIVFVINSSDSVSAMTVTQPTLAQNHVQRGKDSYHAIITGKSQITQWQDILVSHSLHAHIASKPPMIFVGRYESRARTFAILKENRIFTVDRENRSLVIH